MIISNTIINKLFYCNREKVTNYIIKTINNNLLNILDEPSQKMEILKKNIV
jgi:hypothetical protein